MMNDMMPASTLGAAGPSGQEVRPVVINVAPGGQLPPTGKSAFVEIAGDLAAMAWPLLIALFLILFRGQLAEFIGRIRNVEAPGVKVSTDQLIDDTLPDTSGPAETVEQQVAMTKAEEAAQLAPIDAIITAWVSVERRLREVTGRPSLEIAPMIFGAPVNRGYSSWQRNVQALERRELLDSETGALIRDLGGIRNQVAHGDGGEISRDSVERYVANAALVVERLDRIEVRP